MRVASRIYARVSVVSLTVLIAISSCGFLAFEGLAQPSTWTDLFDDESHIAQKSNVMISGGDVSLGSSGMNWYRYGVVLDIGPVPSTFESVLYPSVLKGDDGVYRMWHTGTRAGTPTNLYIRFATSNDGTNWERMGLVIGTNASLEDRVFAPTVTWDGATYEMWYVGDDFHSPYGSRIFYATSPDGYTWTRQGLAMNIGLEGTYDTDGVSFPAVIKEGGTYKMWYSGHDGSNWRILYATSLDGMSWLPQGLAINLGFPPSDYDHFAVFEPAVVKDSQGTYHAWYTGSDGANYRILNATSSDGLVWTKLGLSMDIIPGTPEDSKVLPGSAIIQPNSVVSMWYGGVDSANKGRIFFANYTRSGHIVSEAIGPYEGCDWTDFFANKTDPTVDLFATFTVLDGADWTLVPGYWNLSTTQFSLLSVDSVSHPTIRLRADLWDLQNTIGPTPLLHDWTVVWMDLSPPTFGGLDSAIDDQTGGSVTLSWNPATDFSTPITYNVYIAVTSLGQNFAAANHSTTSVGTQITSLENGVTYYFIVRAEDTLGYEESNFVERNAMPTTPIDSTPPNFAGLESAVDSGTGGNVSLSWSAATDPDSLECNSDPSLPIAYNIYSSVVSGGQDFLTPNATTSNTNYEITGLTNGIPYYFVVRAVDSASNEEQNLVEMSATPTTPVDSTPPIFTGLESATDLGTGGAVRLIWTAADDPDTAECNTDPSLPITYNIYYSRIPGGQDFLNPNATTQNVQADTSGLQNGVFYYFIVRAEDSVGNEETNLIGKSAVPTTPVDSTPPDFQGLQSATDAGIGGTINLTWFGATDPDTPECNSDPSLPISYYVFYSTTPGGQDFLTPDATTPNLSIDVTGLIDGVPYYFVVRARDSVGNEETNTVERTAFSTTPTDDTPPSFAGVESAVDSQTGGNVTLTWSAATDPDTIECNSDPSEPITYSVYVSTFPGTQNFLLPNATTQGTQIEITGLKNGITYYFVVRARDAAGNEESNLVEMSAMPTTPVDDTPPNFSGLVLASDSETGGSVDLVWAEATDPDLIECNSDPSLPITYNVYYSTTSGGQDFSTPDTSTTSTAMQIIGLQNGVVYYFVVRAEDAVGNEENNAVEDSAMPTTPVDSTPPDFQGLQSATDSGTSGNVSLSWQAGNDPDTIECNSDPSIPLQYNIYVAVASREQNFSSPNQTTAGTQTTATGLQNGIMYYFVVRAVDTAGNEDDNVVEMFAMPTTPIDSTPPSFGGLDLIVTNNETSEIRLEWDAATDPDDPECNSDPSTPIKYNIYVSESPSFDFTEPTASTNSQQYVFLDFEKGVTYYFIVRAEDGAGNEESNTVTKSTSLTVPLNFLDYWWLILIIVVAVVGAVLAVLLAKRRRKKEPVQETEESLEQAEEEAPPEERPQETTREE
jgi:predicted GH43/DUF377 family glycosyl hydrolase